MPEVPNINQIAKQYNEAAARGQRLAFLMCATELQKAEVIELERVCAILRESKRAAILAQDEHAANHFLGLESLLKAITWELRMWIALKEQQAHEAWTALVEAQEHACLGLRTPVASPGAAGLMGRLQVLERTLFPFLQFVSVGLTHAGGKCSICREPFRSCPHVQGHIYCGRVCAEVELQSVQLDHGAIVDVPYDKRCYVTEYTKDNMWYDVMTRLPTGPVEPDGQGEGHRLKSIVLTPQAPPGVNV